MRFKFSFVMLHEKATRQIIQHSYKSGNRNPYFIIHKHLKTEVVYFAKLIFLNLEKYKIKKCEIKLNKSTKDKISKNLITNQ